MKGFRSVMLLVSIWIFMGFISNDRIPNNGLIAYYSFDDCTAKDLTDGGSDGQLFGKITCQCGVDGNGLMLHGDQDYIQFDGRVNQYFNTTDFTLSFYVRPIGTSIFKQSMISKRAACEELNMLDIQYNQQMNEVTTDFYETENKYFPDLSPEMEEAGWFHFALVRKGIHAYTYINGQFRQESRRCSGVDIANEALLSFGNSPCVWNGGTRRFNGVIDELRVYDKALSHFEIKHLYEQFPVELAENNCYTYEENNLDRTNNITKSDYLCASFEK